MCIYIYIYIYICMYTHVCGRRVARSGHLGNIQTQAILEKTMPSHRNVDKSSHEKGINNFRQEQPIRVRPSLSRALTTITLKPSLPSLYVMGVMLRRRGRGRECFCVGSRTLTTHAHIRTQTHSSTHTSTRSLTDTRFHRAYTSMHTHTQSHTWQTFN